ncbi:hypothetical protein [Priestia megaterium]|uniref:hypothetical protein n=1 Tax=Priestia megaterium TaxID=1404 RepID=UPI003CEC3C19
MIYYGLLIAPLLISVQDFAFRGSLRLALQSTARSNETPEIYVHPTNKKIRTKLILHQESSPFGSSFN